jgi:ketosteroid isomerase-like protein
MTSLQPIFDRYAAAWEARDAGAIAALHTDDSVFHLHAAQEPAHGREAVRDAFGAMFEQWPDLSFDLVSLHLGADFWAVQWRVRSEAFEADLADIVTVEDGLVKSKQSYIDALAVQAQLEAVPEAA